MASRFFRTVLRSAPSRLEPFDELLVEGQKAMLAAHPSKEYLIYDSDRSSLKIDLSSAEGVLRANWYKPRIGE